MPAEADPGFKNRGGAKDVCTAHIKNAKRETRNPFRARSKTLEAL